MVRRRGHRDTLNVVWRDAELRLSCRGVEEIPDNGCLVLLHGSEVCSRDIGLVAMLLWHGLLVLVLVVRLWLPRRRWRAHQLWGLAVHTPVGVCVCTCCTCTRPTCTRRLSECCQRMWVSVPICGLPPMILLCRCRWITVRLRIPCWSLV